MGRTQKELLRVLRNAGGRATVREMCAASGMLRNIVRTSTEASKARGWGFENGAIWSALCRLERRGVAVRTGVTRKASTEWAIATDEQRRAHVQG